MDCGFLCLEGELLDFLFFIFCRVGATYVLLVKLEKVF